MCRYAMILALAIFPSVAAAHDGLQRSSPAKDAVLAVVPGSLRLTFTNAPKLQFARIQLLDPANVPIALSELRLDSVRTVVADVRGPLRAGRYTVVWQIAGADGHPVRGRFSFSIAIGAAGIADTMAGGHRGGEPGANVPAPGADSVPAAHHQMPSVPSENAFDAESPAYVVVRWVTFLALLIVIGVFAFQAVVLPLFVRRSDPATSAALSEAAGRRAAGIGAAAAATLFVAALARLFAQSYAMHGGGGALDMGLVATMLTETLWGWGWITQAIAALLAVFAFRAMRVGRGWGFGVAGVAVLALAVTPALSGHAASASRLKPLAIAADALHVLGAGGWLGSLLIVLAVGIPAALALDRAESRGSAVADIVNAFSPTALVFAGIAGATGLFSAWLHIESLSNVWGSTYGRVLLLKLAILSVVAATGAYNWLRVRPALGDIEGATRIRRSARIEIAIGAVVLLVTAVLVATPAPMEMPMDMPMGGE